MHEPYNAEAEHGLLGAMLQRPELIDTLSDDLTPESFYFAENAEVFRGIMALRAAGSWERCWLVLAAYCERHFQWILPMSTWHH